MQQNSKIVSSRKQSHFRGSDKIYDPTWNSRAQLGRHDIRRVKNAYINILTQY